jgi:hypothetical protein
VNAGDSRFDPARAQFVLLAAGIEHSASSIYDVKLTLNTTSFPTLFS